MNKKILTFFLCFLLYSNAFSRSSIDVSLQDQTYDFIDLLVAHNLIYTSILGHRPWSREEVSRLIKEARENWEKKKESCSKKRKNWIEIVLKKLEKEYEVEINSSLTFHVHPLGQTSLEINFLEDPPRYFPQTGYFGSIVGFSQPLVQYREGRDYTDGLNVSLETEHWAQISPFSSWYFKPRFQFSINEDGNTNGRFLVQELYGAIAVANVKLQFGRSPLVFGQSRYGGFMLSNNARPLDHICLTNNHPFQLPWLLKYLGQNKWSFFYANMGPDFYFPYAHYAGYKLTLKPSKYFEFGIGNELLIGGDGAPDYTTKNFISDWIGFSGTGNGTSDRILGFDGRLLLPFLRGTQIYAEAFLDDKSLNNLEDTFFRSSAYKIGVDIFRLNDEGTLFSNLEIKYLSPRFYRHGQFTGGYTRYDYLMGDALGPDSWSFSSNIGAFINLKTKIRGELSFEKIQGDYYLSSDEPEKRWRGVFSLNHELKKRLLLQAKIGFEHIEDYEFIHDKTKNNFLIQANLTFDFDKI